MGRATAHEAFLGRTARSGTWAELSRGTYRVIHEAIDAGDWDTAAELLPVTILEAEELHEVYGAWPGQVVRWIIDAGADPDEVAAGHAALLELISPGSPPDWEGAWSEYVRLTGEATVLCTLQAPSAGAAVEAARECWRAAHDVAVDHIYGLLDLAVRLHGEDCLPRVWDHLMADWYDEHARRLSRDAQPWEESARQLAMAIVDGFHGHLAGADRLGDVELIEEPDRIGFRFAPCGSGGRVMDDATTGGQPRMEPPYGFAVTTEPHDWSFGKAGVCAYCVHCCLLNMTEPMDRLGHPTRVIEPPIWPASREGSVCTWWVYREVEAVPDEVYHQVGRRPGAAATGPSTGPGMTREGTAE